MPPDIRNGRTFFRKRSASVSSGAPKCVVGNRGCWRRNRLRKRRRLRGTPPFQRLLWIGAACAGWVPYSASAQPADVLPIVTVEGACPDAEAVRALLHSLLPAGGASAAPATPTVVDRGDVYVVAVGERTKTYADPARDCAQRARVVAAFIALVIAPESLPPESIPSAPAPPSAPPSPTPMPSANEAPPPFRWAHLDARGTLQAASPPKLSSPGAELGVAGGWGTFFGARAGCAWMAGASIRPPGERGSVLLERFPCAVSAVARLLPRERWLEVDAEAGVAAGAVRASGQGFVASYSSTRLEVGARLAVSAALWLSPRASIAPVAGLELTYYPAQYGLSVMPHGVLATTPSLWAGATAGVCWNAL
jgi:hypothetical protein